MMEQRRQPVEELEVIFRPKSVAVVGVSPRELNVNRFFLESLLKMQFPGKVFAVNIKGEPVDEFPTYKRLTDIPDTVDHVIVAVPAKSVWDVIQDAAKKGVRSVSIFTSGFAESGDPKGIELEERLRSWVRTQPLRLIGPNCMGIYCPKSGISFRPDFPTEAGTIGYVSQSGGMTISGVLLGASRGLRYSKAVSYGNEVDVSSWELLEYLAYDPETEVVWLYIEGCREVSRLTQAMKKVTEKKPLLVLKGGHTPSGGRAARSHTGSMAGSWEIWRGYLNQVGALEVEDLEGLVDTTQCIQWLPRPKGRRIALLCVSGGLSVNYTDQATKAGFQVPAFSPSVVRRLREVLDLPGTSVENPVDMAAGFFRWPLFPKIFEALEDSREVDLIVLVLALEYFHIPEHRIPGITMETAKTCLRGILELELPAVVVIPHRMDWEKVQQIEKMFLEAKVPVFPSMARAIRALELFCR